MWVADFCDGVAYPSALTCEAWTAALGIVSGEESDINVMSASFMTVLVSFGVSSEAIDDALPPVVPVATGETIGVAGASSFFAAVGYGELLAAGLFIFGANRDTEGDKIVEFGEASICVVTT